MQYIPALNGLQFPKLGFWIPLRFLVKMYHILTILKPKGFLLTHPCHHPHFFNTANYRHEPEHVQGEARLAHFIAPTIWGIWTKWQSERAPLITSDKSAFSTWMCASRVTSQYSNSPTVESQGRKMNHLHFTSSCTNQRPPSGSSEEWCLL